jgi:hypothetical protein
MSSYPLDDSPTCAIYCHLLGKSFTALQKLRPQQSPGPSLCIYLQPRVCNASFSTADSTSTLDNRDLTQPTSMLSLLVLVELLIGPVLGYYGLQKALPPP